MLKKLFPALVILIGITGLAYATAVTQDAIGPTHTAETKKQPIKLPQTEAHDGVWDKVWGVTPANQIFAGMWVLHFNQSSRKEDNWQANLLGVQYDGFFVVTFNNSFYDQSLAAGFGRQVYQTKMSENTLFSTGYRLGGIYGYDDRIGDIGKYTPIIPFAQFYADFQYKNFGIELSYMGVIATAGFYMTF
ncbi:hypothetical protein N8865_01800 [Francisellaceae bacterium]|nr:hypothetical protein [Francisellaceae bacterium]